MDKATLDRVNYLSSEITDASIVKAATSDETRTVYITSDDDAWIVISPEMSPKVLAFINQLYRERLIDLEAEILYLKYDE